MSDAKDVQTDEGLRRALRDVGHAASWDAPAGQGLLAEIRRRAVRNAAHVARVADMSTDRGLVDDVVTAAWIVLRRHGDAILAARRPWAYLMSSAQKQVSDDVRAQQLLTNSAAIRGRARDVLPRWLCLIGSTAADLGTALRHEPFGPNSDPSVDRPTLRQPTQHEQPPLIHAQHGMSSRPLNERERWFVAFIDLLVANGADKDVTVAAVDRLADLFPVTYVGWWEWAARRDPVLAQLGLSPDQSGALVALVAGSRRYRHNGKRDSLLVATRAACDRDKAVALSPAQLRRLAQYAGKHSAQRQPGQTLLPMSERVLAGRPAPTC
ncbi:MAG: hypothetical protein ACRDT6_19530 [Micromonosporaceae bacterium]